MFGLKVGCSGLGMVRLKVWLSRRTCVCRLTDMVHRTFPGLVDGVVAKDACILTTLNKHVDHMNDLISDVLQSAATLALLFSAISHQQFRYRHHHTFSSLSAIHSADFSLHFPP